MSGIAEGDGDEDRDGEEIMVNSIEIRGTMLVDTDVTVDTICRIIVFRANKNLDGVLPITTEILEVDNVLALRQNLNKGDFKVYYDRVFVIKVPTTTADQHVRYFQKLIRLKSPGMKAHYDQTNNLIAACEKGYWFMIRMVDKPTGQQATFDFFTRVNFKNR